MSPPAKAPPAPRRPPVYRQIRIAPLTYDEETEIELPVNARILGVHAQPAGGVDDAGEPRQKYARAVEPVLVYLHEAGVPLEPMRVLLLRGQAELPLDPDKTYEFIGATVDKHPRHSGFASAWKVTTQS